MLFNINEKIAYLEQYHLSPLQSNPIMHLSQYFFHFLKQSAKSTFGIAISWLIIFSLIPSIIWHLPVNRNSHTWEKTWNYSSLNCREIHIFEWCDLLLQQKKILQDRWRIGQCIVLMKATVIQYISPCHLLLVFLYYHIWYVLCSVPWYHKNNDLSELW